MSLNDWGFPLTRPQGWPWHTTAFCRWTATETFPDGSPYNNHGVHIITLKWAKVVAIDANEDSQVVAKFLRARFEQGCTEAGERAITS